MGSEKFLINFGSCSESIPIGGRIVSRQRRIKVNGCYACGNPVLDGSGLCSRCRGLAEAKLKRGGKRLAIFAGATIALAVVSFGARGQQRTDPRERVDLGVRRTQEARDEAAQRADETRCARCGQEAFCGKRSVNGRCTELK